MIARSALRAWQALASRGRALLFRFSGMNVGERCWLGAIEFPRRPETISLGDGAMLDRGVTLLATCDSARIAIGTRVYLNRHVFIDASACIEIGDETMIGPFCYITDHDHTFGAGVAPGAGPLVSEPVRLGARVWLGAGVKVLKGVTIGEGTVVGAGSVVAKSLPPGVLAVGVPAKVIRTLA